MSNAAVVNRAAFCAAVHQRRIRRRIVVRGARTGVPKDVLIYRDGRTLVVDTPTVAIRLPMQGIWNVCASVPARALAIIAPKLATKLSNDLRLAFAANSLIVDDGIFVLPATEKDVPTERQH